jgi:hypothetical protein
MGGGPSLTPYLCPPPQGGGEITLDHLPVLESPIGVELHQGPYPRAECRATTGDGGRLDGFEEFAFGCAVLNRPPHVREDAILTPTTIRQDTDDHHFAILDRQCFALTDG